MAANSADILVIGGGTMGLATGWAAARRGLSVIVIERFPFFHTMGSHGGHTRIFRHAYFEGARYIPWCLEGDRLFGELQDRTGIELRYRNGCLDMGAPGTHHTELALASCCAHQLPHEHLTGRDINERFPGWNVPDDWDGCFDPHGGTMLVEPCFRALRQEFDAAGGMLVDSTPVTDWSADESGVTVTTETETYHGDRLVITAGAWSGKILADLALPMVVTRKPVWWWKTDDVSLFRPELFPAYIADAGDGLNFYGLPAVGDDSLKMGIHSDYNEIDPDDFERETSAAEITDSFREFVSTCMNGVHPELVATGMCMYTMTPDEDFVIDRHPTFKNVAIAAGFSGHGFKFAPVVGEHLVDLVTNATSNPLDWFRIDRFAEAIAG